MAFDEVRLPVELERGALGGPGFLTNVFPLNSGKEQRNQIWSVDRGKWDIGYGIQTREDALQVRNFFMARRGRARGFRFRDWTNYTTFNRSTQSHDLQGFTADGDGTTSAFQMQYRYTDDGNFYFDKTIYKPVASTIRAYVDGVEDTGISVDSTTGIVTFSSPPAYSSWLTWQGDFDLPVRFDVDNLEGVVTNVNVISYPSIPIVEIKI